MNLEVGCYIIKPRSKRVFKKFHYLRVFKENKNKYVQIDDGPTQEANEDLQILLKSHILVKRMIYHNPIGKSLEKRLKKACKQKFRIPYKEIEKCAIHNSDYLLLKHKDKVFLFIEFNSYYKIVKTSIIEGVDSHTRIPWNVLVNSKISIWYEKPQFRSVLWQSLNKDEREFYRSIISPNGVMKEADYWEGLYSDPEVYQKALKALYDTFPSPDKLVSEIVKVGFNRSFSELLIDCKKIDEIKMFLESKKQPSMRITDQGPVLEEYYVDVYSTEGSGYPHLYDYLMEKNFN